MLSFEVRDDQLVAVDLSGGLSALLTWQPAETVRSRPASTQPTTQQCPTDEAPTAGPTPTPQVSDSSAVPDEVPDQSEHPTVRPA